MTHEPQDVTATQPLMSMMAPEGAEPEPERRPLFPMAFRGYDREQVEQHLDDVDAQLHRMAEQRDALERALEQAREQLAIATASEAAAGHPSYSAMGQRVAQIFTLAEEEAAELRAAAAAEAAQAQGRADAIVAEGRSAGEGLLDQARAAAAEAEAERDRRLAEVDGLIAQRQAAAEAAAADRQAELERTLAAEEASARARLADIQAQYDDLVSRVRDIAARMGGAPAGEPVTGPSGRVEPAEPA